MGLITTSLLNSKNLPVIVPNSFFSGKVIVNESRAKYRGSITKIPLKIVDLSMIPRISDDVISKLRSNAEVFLEKDIPLCSLSCKGSSYAELTIRYNLKRMVCHSSESLNLSYYAFYMHSESFLFVKSVWLAFKIPGFLFWNSWEQHKKSLFILHCIVLGIYVIILKMPLIYEGIGYTYHLFFLLPLTTNFVIIGSKLNERLLLDVVL